MGCAAYAFRQMKTKPKSIYLFLSSEKDFAAFCRILRKTRKCIETIDAVAFPLFSGCSWNVP
jgi:HrpA-like RNA helicase